MALGDLITLAEGKAALNKANITDVEDSEIADMISAVSEWISDKVGGAAGLTQFTETKRGGLCLILNQTPIVTVISITPLTPGVVTNFDQDLIIHPNSGVIEYSYGYEFYGPQLVVYQAGVLRPPISLKLAAKLLLAEMYESQRVAPGNYATPDGMNDMQLGIPVPSRVEQLISPFIKQAGVA